MNPVRKKKTREEIKISIKNSKDKVDFDCESLYV